MFRSTFEDFFPENGALQKYRISCTYRRYGPISCTYRSYPWKKYRSGLVGTLMGSPTNSLELCHEVAIILLHSHFNLCVILSWYWKLFLSEMFTSQVVMVAGLWTFDPDHNWDLRKSPEHLSSSSIWVFWFVDRSWYMSVGKIEAAQVMSVGPAKQESKDSWTWI